MREYTFTVSRGMNHEEEYTITEAELEQKHIDVLTGELLVIIRDYPISVQKSLYNKLRKAKQEVEA